MHALTYLLHSISLPLRGNTGNVLYLDLINWIVYSQLKLNLDIVERMGRKRKGRGEIHKVSSLHVEIV